MKSTTSLEARRIGRSLHQAQPSGRPGKSRVTESLQAGGEQTDLLSSPKSLKSKVTVSYCVRQALGYGAGQLPHLRVLP